MRFWCSASSRELWTWAWKPYVGVWVLCLGLALAYLLAVRKRRHTMAPEPGAGRRTAAFLGGVAVLWAASDWPIGLLGSSYLASVHMFQYMIYTLAAAPLLVIGIPEWMARRLLGKLRLYRFARAVSRPLVAGILFNVVLIGTNLPLVVDTARANQMGSFALDMTWLLSGLLLWMPICSTIPEISRYSYPLKMAYLFLAAGTLPMIPGGFLTFAEFPLYRTYELAPRVYGISAINDQQFAGALMKVGNIPVIWAVIAVMSARWWRQEQAERAAEVAAAPPGASHAIPHGFAANGTGQRMPGRGGYAPPVARRSPRPGPASPSP